MMKKLVYSALAIFCFAVVSCTNEAPSPGYGEDYIVLNVFNSAMTMAEGDPATAYERQLKRLDCFFYVKDQTSEPCVYYHRVDIDEQVSATVPFYVNDLVLKEIFPSGSLCDVFVIANLPADYTFEANGDNTTMTALGELVLDMNKKEYDVVGKPFVMTGGGKVQKNRNSSATADIKLERVASKVTMTVKVPKKLEVENGDAKVTMLPVLKDDKGNEPLKTSFRYGTNKGYLSGTMPDDPKNYIWTDKISYTQSEETDSHYILTCDVPFYTYSRSWEKGSDNAAYVTFEMPWGKDVDNNGEVEEYKTYYYQILVSGKDRCFTPNTCYEMVVTVGVLGSSVEAIPKVLDELSYYVLEWTTETSDTGTGDRNENVEIEKYNYLEVPQKYIEMDNVNTVAIRYNASHKIGVKFADEKARKVEGLESTTTHSAFYIENGSGTPVANKISDTVLTLNDAFEDNNKGSLTFKCDLSELQAKLNLKNPIYSPVYVFITIWLDVNGNGTKDSDETLTEDVTIVIYPAIYIVGDKSSWFSVFVNGNYNSGHSTSNSSLNYVSIAGEQAGKAFGYNEGKQEYMPVISVSSFNKQTDEFTFSGNTYSYIIGDPRSRNYETFKEWKVPEGGNGWVKAKAVDRDGNEIKNETESPRYLKYYRPTDDEASFQIIAPKFRISSRLAGYSHCKTIKGAQYRCASYQEAGYPAGRWRLPTTAEVLFVINLQEQNQIQELFVGSSNYLSATHTINNNGRVTVYDDVILNDNKVSVRCVYDDWYWGSEPVAIPNNSNAYKDNGGYEFTWGDIEVY